MGFLSFFKKIGNGIKKTATSIGNGIKKVSVKAYHTVIRPAYKKVIKPIYTSVVKPVAKKAISFVEHSIARAEKIADAGASGAEGIGDLFKNIGNSPMLIIGLVGVGALVALKR